MRWSALARALVVVALVIVSAAGCGSEDAQHGGGMDMAVPDLATGDLATPAACSTTDPMTDGTPCNSGVCPPNTTGVNSGGSCKCYQRCTTDPECSCNRLCDPLTRQDAGVVGSACLVGNEPGTRCGRDAAGQPFGHVFCSQLAICVNADQAQVYRYCSYKCEKQSDCPAQTNCAALIGGNGSVCAYNSGPNGNKSLGDACGAGDVCMTGQLCDSICRAQCDGPGGTCASGVCTRLDDAASGRIIGYVCK